ncbi:MAG: peptidylprolyl isomerase [Chitinophagaceae bacterium]|nr:peptidylprolyl isomerase [Chitinophagaceae bacterium]
MRRWLFLIFCILCVRAESQTLFSYGKHAVSRQEFFNAFNKNRTSADTGKNAMKDYLNLYIVFKLKVQDAIDHQIDTLPSLQADLQSFKNQIRDNYLYDKKEFNFLLEQALSRSRKDILLSGYLLKAKSFADSLTLKKAALNVRDRLIQHQPIDENALAQNGIRLIKQDYGYITVFSLPYQIENVVYRLKPEEYSEPFSFKENYYILRNEGERPAVGKIKIAQILVSSPQNSGPSHDKIKKLADSIYNVLQNGGDFVDLAKQFSDDRMTYLNGGEMPEFGVGKFSPDFEEHVFALKRDGEIAKPFQTAFGFHIVKRISASPVPEKFGEDYVYQMKQELQNDPRIKLAKDKLLDKAKIRTGFSLKHFDKNNFYRISDSSLVANRNISAGALNQNSVLFAFNDHKQIQIKDWDQYIRNSGKIEGGSLLHSSYDKLWPEFIAFSVLRNYSGRLSSFDPEYAGQIRNFNEGNMLFEMMQRKVWNKASKDTDALKNFYDTHQAKYVWNKSAEAVIFSCNNEMTAKQCEEELEHTGWRKVAENHAGYVQADSARFEFSQLPVHKTDIQTGIYSPVVNENDGTASFVQILKLYPSGMQRSFKDARGLVTEDYQKVLERQWVNELKKRYPVKVNEGVLNNLLRENK